MQLRCNFYISLMQLRCNFDANWIHLRWDLDETFQESGQPFRLCFLCINYEKNYHFTNSKEKNTSKFMGCFYHKRVPFWRVPFCMVPFLARCLFAGVPFCSNPLNFSVFSQIQITEIGPWFLWYIELILVRYMQHLVHLWLIYE